MFGYLYFIKDDELKKKYLISLNLLAMAILSLPLLKSIKRLFFAGFFLSQISVILGQNLP